MSVKKSQIEKLRDKLSITEQLLVAELSLLPRFNDECNCERKLGTVKIVDQNSIDNQSYKYCLECGGFCG